MASASDHKGPFQGFHSQEGLAALAKEQQLPQAGWQQEVQRGHAFGLEGADSIRDRSISTFSRGELPHFAGINTFLKAPYLEDVHQVGRHDVAVMWTPRKQTWMSGCTPAHGSMPPT